MQKNKLGGGLQPLPHDARDFSLAGVFGQPRELPEVDFIIAEPLAIKNQGDTDMCTGYAVTYASEAQEKTILSPEYQFAKTKQIEGTIKTWGANLRDACKSAVDYGSLEAGIIPMNTETHDRNHLATWTNWGFEADWNARKHKKQSFFSVDGARDTFDNIRSSLWAHRGDKCAVMTGMKWRSSWTYATGGIVTESYEDYGFGHAFIFIGQKLINNEWYLVAQLSNGVDIGDEGLFYFPRNVVNKECAYGNYMFTDLPKEEAKKLNTTGAKMSDFWIIKIYKQLKTSLWKK